jgi:hypothetical protein
MHHSRCVLMVAMLALLLGLVACGGKQPSPEPSPSSGVHGILLFGGGPGIISPSPLPDGFGTTKLGRPYSFATITVKAKSGTQAVLSVKPASDGLFSIALPPGTYVLTPKVPKNGPWPLPTTVVVKPGKFTRALVYVSGM